MHWKCALAGIAMAIALAPTPASADSVTEIENARAKERSGLYLNGRDREQLRRWGGSSDYGRYAYRPYDDGYYGGYYYAPGVSIYVDPY
jgi:hypothetical protein